VQNPVFGALAVVLVEVPHLLFASVLSLPADALAARRAYNRLVVQ